jgi:hypothetical protein
MSDGPLIMSRLIEFLKNISSQMLNIFWRLTTTDLRAEDFCPMANTMMNSGPSNPRHASPSLSLIEGQIPSPGAGMLGYTEVQQHRNVVTRHVNIIS